MKILFIGDVIGKTGRKSIVKHLPTLIKEKNIDFVIANGEHISHGYGIQEEQCKPLFEAGIDCFTGGNHTFKNRAGFHFISSDKRILRPENFPLGSIGRGFEVYEKNGKKTLVINLIGQIYMDTYDSPFVAADKIMEKFSLGNNIDAIFVDFHAEATSEKMGIGHYLDGRVSAVAGSHTHVPTADLHIMEKGTGYITDAGMCGDYNSMIGMKTEGGLHKLISKVPNGPFEVSKGEASFVACIFETDESGLCKSVEQIKIDGFLERVEL
ncbi:MAG: YmdB family metallophosphoesterase [Alphaproteobacteria bacterium]|jgi:metallophosphoesterase (TIGR00282 family)|nr:YmdB family metallophosphoesterase [Alphaproteobacteria bacterium]